MIDLSHGNESWENGQQRFATLNALEKPTHRFWSQSDIDDDSPHNSYVPYSAATLGEQIGPRFKPDRVSPTHPL